jgi:signal transduction histidine kinase
VSDGVELSVSDAGRGFDIDDRGTGYGLGTMQRRADLIGADLRVTSAPGRGTTVVVSWAGSGTTSLVDTAEVPDRPERSNA